MPQLTGKVYPDKSFSLGVVPSKKARPKDKKYEREVALQPEVDYSALSDWLVGKTNVLGEFRSTSEAPLFIEAPKSSPKSRGGYGKNGITGYGRRVVRNSCILLEKKYGKRRLGFVTCTLPGFSGQVIRRITSVWGEIVRRFYQKMRRHLKKLSKQFIYVGVTEIQERRFKNSGVPVPHLHFVYLCRDSSNGRYYMYVCQIHRAWNEAIREGLNYSGYPFTMSDNIPWGSVHCKRVQKSASAYLGKYMTKGGRVVKDMIDKGFREFPKQWWNACMQMKKMFKESIIYLDSHACNDLFYRLADYLHDGLVTWARYVDTMICGEYRTIGLVGTFSASAYASMRY